MIFFYIAHDLWSTVIVIYYLILDFSRSDVESIDLLFGSMKRIQKQNGQYVSVYVSLYTY
jgi:hypothetical protein